jgi:AbrB family looped-hinge helix DNA binding protein
MNLSTTKMSSKGQIVIPEMIRDELGLGVGTQFVIVAGSEDTIILKTIQPPSSKEIKSLLAISRKAASSAGAKKSDIKNAIKKGRSGK